MWRVERWRGPGAPPPYIAVTPFAPVTQKGASRDKGSPCGACESTQVFSNGGPIHCYTRSAVHGPDGVVGTGLQ